MRPEAALSWWRDRDRWERCTVAAWMLLLGVVCARGIIWPRANSVYPILGHAARSWEAGEDLYAHTDPASGDLDVYRYSPLVAAALIPFSAVPDPVGGAFWRLLNAGILLW